MKRTIAMWFFGIVLSLSVWSVGFAQQFNIIGNGQFCTATIVCSPLSTPLPAELPTHIDAYRLTDGRAVNVTCADRQVAVIEQYPNRVLVGCAGATPTPVINLPTVVSEATLSSITPTPKATENVFATATPVPTEFATPTWTPLQTLAPTVTPRPTRTPTATITPGGPTLTPRPTRTPTPQPIIDREATR